tara:strand:- start:1877 stop:2188 length:312 start_codon:yes stop_codon:yes gene_type:complete
MTTKRQIIKALDAAGFRGVQIHYYRNVECRAYWAFFGGEAERWYNGQIAPGFTLADPVEAWIECAKNHRADNIEHLETDEDEDPGVAGFRIVVIEDNSATFIP